MFFIVTIVQIRVFHQDLDCLQMSDDNAIGLTGLKTCTNLLQKMMQLTRQFPQDTAAYGGDEGDSLHATW